MADSSTFSSVIEPLPVSMTTSVPSCVLRSWKSSKIVDAADLAEVQLVDADLVVLDRVVDVVEAADVEAEDVFAASADEPVIAVTADQIVISVYCRAVRCLHHRRKCGQTGSEPFTFSMLISVSGSIAIIDQAARLTDAEIDLIAGLIRRGIQHGSGSPPCHCPGRR